MFLPALFGVQRIVVDDFGFLVIPNFVHCIECQTGPSSRQLSFKEKSGWGGATLANVSIPVCAKLLFS